MMSSSFQNTASAILPHYKFMNILQDKQQIDKQYFLKLFLF